MFQGRPEEANPDEDDDVDADGYDIGGDDEPDKGFTSRMMGTAVADNIRDIASQGGGLYSMLHTGACIS